MPTAEEILFKAMQGFSGSDELPADIMAQIGMPTGPAGRSDKPVRVWLSMDRSVSMADYVTATKTALTEFVMSIAANTANVDLDLELFNERRSVRLLNRRPISEFTPSSLDGYVIDGGTAIYDTIISIANQLLADASIDRKARNVFAMQTDGEDMNSIHSVEDAALAVNKLKRAGWEVIFLGGSGRYNSQDALAYTAKLLGFPEKNTLTYDMKTSKGISEAGANIGKYIAGQTTDAGFSDAQRQIAGELRKHTKLLPQSDTTAVKDKAPKGQLTGR